MKRKRSSEKRLQRKKESLSRSKNPSSSLAPDDWRIIKRCIFGYLKTQFPSRNFQFGSFNELYFAFAESQNETIKNNRHFRNWVARLYISLEHPIIHRMSPFRKVPTGEVVANKSAGKSVFKKERKKKGHGRFSPKYTAYLKSSKWKEKRKEALDFYGRKCSECSVKSNLQVHHLTYDNLFNERIEDLRILCKKCHEAVHGRKFD